MLLSVCFSCLYLYQPTILAYLFDPINSVYSHVKGTGKQFDDWKAVVSVFGLQHVWKV